MRWPLLLFGIMLIALSSAAEESQTTVPAGMTSTESFDLETGDSITGSISVSGGADNDIGYSLKDPTGNELYTKRTIKKGTSFQFTATKSGTYTIVLDNTGADSGRTVSISYDVLRPNPTPQTSVEEEESGSSCFSAAILLSLLCLVGAVRTR